MQLPEITIADIEKVARSFGHTFDDERLAILTHRTTADVRACPGSGKTSLLVAKLAILSSQWKSRHQGMCIVSHTNVAHREIQKRFAMNPAMHRLDGYPHFLGTLQSFVDTFLGIPAVVERYGKRPVVIDNDTFADVALRRFREGPYYRARGYCEHHRDGLGVVATLRYAGPTLELRCDGTLPGPDSATFKELTSLKETLSRWGFFRFEDMTAHGLWLLEKHPSLAPVIATRFPVVFIDEMQDTVDDQERLLDIVFGGRAIVQRFGDDRQAIFQSETRGGDGGRFPRGIVLPMKRSHRLSPSIATLAQNVCDGAVEELIGNAGRPTCTHTVFVFPRERIDRVLPAFAALADAEIGADMDHSQFRAVGATTKLKTEDEKFPSAIGDYWPRYTPLTGRGSAAPADTRRSRYESPVDIAGAGESRRGKENPRRGGSANPWPAIRQERGPRLHVRLAHPIFPS